MYGEKQEETEELRLDLQDIKLMYKAQVHITQNINILCCVGRVEIKIRKGWCTANTDSKV